MNQFRKYTQYHSLESGWSIAQTKRKDPICKGTPRTSENGLILVFQPDLDLIVPAETI